MLLMGKSMNIHYFDWAIFKFANCECLPEGTWITGQFPQYFSVCHYFVWLAWVVYYLESLEDSYECVKFCSHVVFKTWFFAKIHCCSSIVYFWLCWGAQLFPIIPSLPLLVPATFGGLASGLFLSGAPHPRSFNGSFLKRCFNADWNIGSCGISSGGSYIYIFIYIYMHQIPPWSLFGGTDSDWRCQMNAFRGRLDLQGRLDLHTYIHTYIHTYSGWKKSCTSW